MNKRPKSQFRALLLLIVSAFLFTGCQEPQLTISDLLDELVDRDEIAKLPKHEFTLHQASSYSRKSVSPDKPGWFDNDDNTKYVAIDTTKNGIEYVLMDVKGPGAVVRFWSAWHSKYFSKGTLRFYLDNSPEPQIEGNIEKVLSGNKNFGPVFSFKAAEFLEHGDFFSAHNLYFPISYNSGCKITYQKAKPDANDILYYNINYRKYKDLTVETLPAQNKFPKKLQDKITEIAAKVSETKEEKIVSTHNFSAKIEAGKTKEFKIEGTKAIKHLSLKLKSQNREQALRSLVLKINFDGKEAVWVPVGEFFGTSYKINPNKTWAVETTKEGVLSFKLPMPFKKSATISLMNLSEFDIELEKVTMQVEPWNWDERSLYFHANWHWFPNVGTHEKQDLNYTTITGKGKYVGDVMSLYNTSYSWWGEGDEKIYVDGEKFPSHFGTGTEDYYGYAWCSVVEFQTPFIAQASGDGNRSPGLTVNSRWRMLDVLPFNKSLKLDMELWHWDKVYMDYSSTSFWYGDYNAKSSVKKNIEHAKQKVKFFERKEVEGFDVISSSGKTVLQECFLSYNWSARSHLLWKDVEKGDELKLQYYSEVESEGILRAVFTKRFNSVEFDMYLNGELVLENKDIYGEGESLITFKSSKKVKINQGDNELKIIVKGANSKSEQPYSFGFDYIMIEK